MNGIGSLSSVDTKSLEVEDVFRSLVTPGKWMRFQTCRPFEGYNFIFLLFFFFSLMLTALQYKNY